jgi:hypothetical protein
MVFGDCKFSQSKRRSTTRNKPGSNRVSESICNIGFLFVLFFSQKLKYSTNKKNYAIKKTVSFYLDESYNRKKEDDQYFLTKSDMVQLKAMTQNNPPVLFRDVLAMTCILKNVKPEIRDDPLHVGHTVRTFILY